MRRLLGKRISHYRRLKKLSQRELAAASKVDKLTIWRIENGKSWPQYEKLESIAKALSMTPEQLAGMAESPSEPTAEQLVSALSVALADPKFQALFANVLRHHNIGASES